MNTTNTKQLFLFLLGVLLAGTVYGIRNDAAEQEGQRREGRVERSADLNFIKGNPQRAMAAYKRAYNRMNEMCSNERLNMEQRQQTFRGSQPPGPENCEELYVVAGAGAGRDLL